MSSTFLEVRNLVKRFGRLAAVDDVSFQMRPGEVLTLLGPSGCGKTTTLRSVAGFERPDSGEISIQGRVVYSSARKMYVPPEKRGLGMVFQSYAIWPHMTVAENVAYPLTVRKVSSSEIKRRVNDTLELVGLTGFAERPSILLSGGQQQRVALARALIYEPSVLLLDEPLSNLDAKLRNQMRIELKRLQSRINVTVLFVTHDQIEAMSLSNRLAVMNKGKIEQIGPPREVYEHPQTPFVEDFLGRVLRFRGQVVENGPDGTVAAIPGVGSAQLRSDNADESLAVGDPVLVAIRPEDLQLRPSGGGSQRNVVLGTLEDVIYLGGECELVLRFGDSPYTLTVPRNQVESLGSTVDVYLPAQHVRVWHDPSAQTAASAHATVSEPSEHMMAAQPVPAAVLKGGS